MKYSLVLLGVMAFNIAANSSLASTRVGLVANVEREVRYSLPELTGCSAEFFAINAPAFVDVMPDAALRILAFKENVGTYEFAIECVRRETLIKPVYVSQAKPDGTLGTILKHVTEQVTQLRRLPATLKVDTFTGTSTVTFSPRPPVRD